MTEQEFLKELEQSYRHKDITEREKAQAALFEMIQDEPWAASPQYMK